MNLLTLLGLNLSIILVLMVALWLVSLRVSDASIADPFWGVGFVIVAWTTWLWSGRDEPRTVLLLVMATVWGLRLSAFLLWRNAGHAEDPRYASMRRHHGQRFWWVSFFSVFMLQGILLWLIAFPLQVGIASQSSGSLTLTCLPGIVLWATGLFYEALGDWQLARFKSKPENQNRVLDSGLWRHTRHPNYFGDFCVWWGLYAVAATNGAAWTVFSPLLMSAFLIFVSGVRLTEKDIDERRPEYARYKQQTNAFFPGPRKHVDSIGSD